MPDPLLDHFADVDVLAFESNYDRSMQRKRPPEFLKQRIMNGAGHLSNEQSLHAVRRIAAQSDLDAVMLLHLSGSAMHLTAFTNSTPPVPLNCWADWS